MKKTLGYDLSELYKINFSTLIRVFLESVSEFYLNPVEMNTFPMLEFHLSKKTEERISRLSQKISIIRDEEKITGYSGIIRDITFIKVCRNRRTETRKVIKYNKSIKSINHKSYSHNENFEIFLKTY
jgi:hypothetical protein